MTVFYILLFWQVLDVATTLYGMKLGARETNPVLTKLIKLVGNERIAIIGAKLAFVGLVFLLFPRIPQPVILGITALYIVVVVRNVNVIRKLWKNR